jgi:antitoxin component YwqK of YwqJK toxin-antitoxin module
MTIITAPKNHICRATKRACPFLDNSTSIPQLEKQMDEAIKEQDFGAYAELNEIKEKQEYINFQTEIYAQKENLNNALIKYYKEQQEIIKSMYEKESKQEGTETGYNDGVPYLI